MQVELTGQQPKEVTSTVDRAGQFLKISEEVIEPTIAGAVHAQAQYYRLLRRILIAQANGDFEAGEKLQHVFRGVEHSMTEASFDECMDRAVRQIGGDL
jgi:hypothetical protein